ncbi:hypothetical protein [Phorcysia thermohydrogeniphila]|uniref:Uncharacterized protein n=1 Tax=Phorcysia thermohydrogeniphila TaxID=936138 RepID=A0A4R1G951_9BACT|nr:hypothetical protein [Phorcysia thermohydrogeniphila]TCK04687.1 hypothetical protein CLV27_1120 [Phorcysia thermohydrogeniphila]
MMLELLERILLKCGKERRLITYGELAVELNRRFGKRVVPEKGKGLGRAISKLLHPVCDRYYREFRVLPGSVVVLSKTGMPAEGYFKYLAKRSIFKGDSKKAFWERQLSAFFEFCRKR